MRIFITIARRSVTLPAGLLVAGLVVWLALSSRTPGFSLWPDLVTGLSAASVYGGVLAAGFAAFQAGRWALPAHDRYDLSSRSLVHIRLMHAAGVCAPILLGYVVGILVLGIIGLATGTYGAPFLPWLIAFAAALFLASAAGYAVGAFLGSGWFVAPAAAVGFYALYVLTRSLPFPYGIKSLYPAITNTDSVFVRHIATTMWGQTAFWCALGLAVILASAIKWQRPKRLRVPLVVTAVCLVGTMIVGSSAVLGTNGQYTTGYNSRDFVCKTSSATLCLNRGYVNAMNPLLGQLDKTNARMAGTPLVATRLEQNVEGIGDEPAAGARSIYIEQLGSGGTQFAVYRYLNKYGGRPACKPGVNPETRSAVSYVDSWLSDYSPYADQSSSRELLTKLRALPTAEGNQWFRAHFDRYMSCTLTFSDFQ